MMYWVRFVLMLCALTWLGGTFFLLACVARTNGEQGKMPAMELDEITLTLVWPIAVWIAFWHWTGERRKNRRLARERREGQ